MTDAATTLTTGGAATSTTTANQGAAAAASAENKATAAPWHSFEGETLGYVQNKGWKLDDPKDFATSVVKHYRDLEAFRGIPADRIMAWPKDQNDADGWKALYARLGVPEKPVDYQLTDLKMADGSEVDPSFTEHVRSIAAQHKLTPTQARAVASDMLGYFDKAAAETDAEEKAQLAAQDAEWQKNWGANMQANLQAARQAAAALSERMGPNLGPKLQAALSQLEQTAGKGVVMEMFLALSRGLGEDKFQTGGNGGTSEIMSREQATAKLNDLKRDREWVAKYNSGSAEHVRLFRQLTAQIAGVAWPAHLVR